MRITYRIVLPHDDVGLHHCSRSTLTSFNASGKRSPGSPMEPTTLREYPWQHTGSWDRSSLDCEAVTGGKTEKITTERSEGCMAWK